MPLRTPELRADARRPREIRGAYARRDRSAGFTFIELIVGLAIITMIASVVAPVLLGSLDRARIESSMDTFRSIGTAAFEFEADVGDSPLTLAQLNVPITTSLTNVCSQAYSSGEAGAWVGPYLSQGIPSNGVRVPVGRARNTLTRNPATLAPTELHMAVDSVVLEDAVAMDAEYPDDGVQTTGLVRWTNANADGLVTMTMVMQISGC